MTDAKRFYVTGRVQGVYFRASTHERASALGLSGWVRNMDDGRVEVLACGPASALQKLEAWLWLGPGNARVENVDTRAEAPADYDGFQVR